MKSKTILLTVIVDDDKYSRFTEEDGDEVIKQLTAHWDWEADGILNAYVEDMSVFENLD